MPLLVNPGTHIPDHGTGWTNTEEHARREAQKWLENMRADGIADIELLDTATPVENRWQFTFRHTVTGTTVILETHGIDNLEAYKRENVFEPRVYWNGSSSENPHLAQFAADGYAMTYRPTGTPGNNPAGA